MKKLFLTFLVLVLAIPVFAQTTFHQPHTLVAVPGDGTGLPGIPDYPLMDKKELTADRASNMGLHAEALKKAMTVFNWHRDIKRFVYETLPAGTWVYADANGKPIYKADCANRVLPSTDCPKCNPVPPVVIKPLGKTGTTAVTSAKFEGGIMNGGFWSRLGDFGKILAWSLLALVLLALAAVAAYWVYAWMREGLYSVHDWRDARGHLNPPYVPAPPAPPAEVPPPQPAAVPVAAAPMIPISSSTDEAGRSYIAFYAADKPGVPGKVNFSGFKQVTVAQESGKNTITFG